MREGMESVELTRENFRAAQASEASRRFASAVPYQKAFARTQRQSVGNTHIMKWSLFKNSQTAFPRVQTPLLSLPLNISSMNERPRLIVPDEAVRTIARGVGDGGGVVGREGSLGG